jgi:hypothetical protein
MLHQAKWRLGWRGELSTNFHSGINTSNLPFWIDRLYIHQAKNTKNWVFEFSFVLPEWHTSRKSKSYIRPSLHPDHYGSSLVAYGYELPKLMVYEGDQVIQLTEERTIAKALEAAPIVNKRFRARTRWEFLKKELYEQQEKGQIEGIPMPLKKSKLIVKFGERYVLEDSAFLFTMQTLLDNNIEVQNEVLYKELMLLMAKPGKKLRSNR